MSEYNENKMYLLFKREIIYSLTSALLATFIDQSSYKVSKIMLFNV